MKTEKPKCENKEKKMTDEKSKTKMRDEREDKIKKDKKSANGGEKRGKKKRGRV